MSDIDGFKRVDLFDFSDRVFEMLKNEWMLITAGDESSFNTMTAAWGGFGILWNKPTATIYIRPQRYTYQFTEQNELFSLCYFGSGRYRDALSFCGTKSGRDYDKCKETGLIPLNTPAGCIAFKQSRLIFECRKLYTDTIKPDFFIDKNVESVVYPGKDYHRFYIGEILGCYMTK